MTPLHEQLSCMRGPFGPEQVEQSAALFAALLPPLAETDVRRDLQYGPEARHRFDLYGSSHGSLRPALVFIHGGGFIAGEKGGPGDPFYANIGGWAIKHGWVGIMGTYRLAPEHAWPAGRDDVARLIAWLRNEGPTIGVDPNRIVLMGHSAGAAHVAAYIGHPDCSDATQTPLSAAIMMSGIYDPANAEPSRFQSAYYGSKREAMTAMSSLDSLARSPLPLLYTVAEHDPETFQRQAVLLVSSHVEHNGSWPHMIRLTAHNHITPIHAVGSIQDDVGPVLAEFILNALQ